MQSLLFKKLEKTRKAPSHHGRYETFAAELKAIHPALRLKINKRARRIALRLDSAGQVMNLVVPERFSMKKAARFAQEHQDWVRQKLAALPAPVPFVHGSEIPLLGRKRILNITCNPALKTTDITLNENEIIVQTNKEEPAGRIIRFLKNEARTVLTALAREKAAIIEKPLETVQIRDTRSRWGSCGPDARISLSWRLIFAPREAMDYVVAHEVAHLVHMNHGKQFWALCNRLSADYHSGKQWMRQNGNELLRYGQE